MVAKQQGDGPVVIKKYANRRLYNTSSSSYVTLEHLCVMVKKGEEFVVYDAKSGDDITRSVLTQIIVEEESKGGQNLLPIDFLRQLISFYGDGAQQSVLPSYLDMAMNNFSENQDKIKSYMSENAAGSFPFGNMEEIGRKNMSMFENAMKMFTPFNMGATAEDAESGAVASESTETAETKTPDTTATKEGDALLTNLQKQLDDMQKKLAEIDKK